MKRLTQFFLGGFYVTLSLCLALGIWRSGGGWAAGLSALIGGMAAMGVIHLLVRRGFDLGALRGEVDASLRPRSLTEFIGQPRVREQLELVLEGATRLLVDAPESAVSVALGNLIGNAVKYTQSGQVIVRLHDQAVDVIDSGPGLSPEDAAKLFQRGYRGTHAGHSQGGGIGLSIVRRLCALYGWDVQVRPGDPHGVVATLTFG